MEVDNTKWFYYFIEKSKNKYNIIPKDENKFLDFYIKLYFFSMLIKELKIDSQDINSLMVYGKNIILNILKKSYKI